MGKRAWGCILALASAGFSMTATATDLTLFSATDADLAALKDKQDVQSLLLRGPRVTDAGLSDLKGLKTLRESTWLTPA